MSLAEQIQIIVHEFVVPGLVVVSARIELRNRRLVDYVRFVRNAFLESDAVPESIAIRSVSFPFERIQKLPDLFVFAQLLEIRSEIHRYATTDEILCRRIEPDQTIHVERSVSAQLDVDLIFVLTPEIYLRLIADRDLDPLVIRHDLDDLLFEESVCGHDRNKTVQANSLCDTDQLVRIKRSGFASQQQDFATGIHLIPHLSKPISDGRKFYFLVGRIAEFIDAERALEIAFVRHYDIDMVDRFHLVFSFAYILYAKS